jgi:PncC family amidohydrolase
MKDLIPIAEKIAARLIERKQTIAVAESSTGGLISAALLAVPGASAYFLGSAVVYTRDARRILMDIPDEAMKGIRSASESYASLLASQIRQRFATDWGLSETGATGPTGNRYGDAAGHSCMARQHARVRGYGAEFAAAEFVALSIVVPANAGNPYPAAYRLTNTVWRSGIALLSVVMGPCFRRDDELNYFSRNECIRHAFATPSRPSRASKRSPDAANGSAQGAADDRLRVTWLFIAGAWRITLCQSALSTTGIQDRIHAAEIRPRRRGSRQLDPSRTCQHNDTRSASGHLVLCRRPRAYARSVPAGVGHQYVGQRRQKPVSSAE